jgi:predicted DNA binding CopG/RHH family protein
MNAKSKNDLQLPAGLSPAEEALWWDNHREYWNNADSPDEKVEPIVVRRTKPINLRLPVEMIDDIKRAASRRAIPYQTLIRMWLREMLDAEPAVR